MTEESRNVELLERAYRRWSETKGGSADEWLAICSDRIAFGSIARGGGPTPYLTTYSSRHELKDYFEGIQRDWEMMEYMVDHFVAQGDRVVMVGRCAWRYRKTDKVVWTPKCDVWRFADGKAVEFFEFYDTAQVMAAAA